MSHRKILLSFAALAVFSPSMLANAQTTGQSEAPPPQAAPAGQTWYASKLLDTDVENFRGQSVGEIEDIAFDSDGKIAGVIVSVGGFLGLGDRNIAIQLSDLTITPGSGGEPVVKTSLSDQALAAQPEAQWRDD